MILNCPSCGARFKVDAAQLGSAGRSVRCGSCGHNWHQTAAEAASASEAPGRGIRPDPSLDKLDDRSGYEGLGYRCEMKDVLRGEIFFLTQLANAESATVNYVSIANHRYGKSRNTFSLDQILKVGIYICGDRL